MPPARGRLLRALRRWRRGHLRRHGGPTRRRGSHRRSRFFEELFGSRAQPAFFGIKHNPLTSKFRGPTESEVRYRNSRTRFGRPNVLPRDPRLGRGIRSKCARRHATPGRKAKRSHSRGSHSHTGPHKGFHFPSGATGLQPVTYASSGLFGQSALPKIAV